MPYTTVSTVALTASPQGRAKLTDEESGLDRIPDRELKQETRLERAHAEGTAAAGAAPAPATDIMLKPVTDIDRPELKNALKIPLVELVTAGGMLASLPESMRTITQTMTLGTGRTLFEGVVKEGVSGFMRPALDGIGYTGNIVDAAGTITGRARFVPVAQTLTAAESIVVPIDSVTLAMAAALAMINRRFDALQETQEEMFEYAKRDKKSKQLAGLNTLIEIMSDYKFNWQNKTYRDNKHAQVGIIKQDAEANVIFFRDEVNAKLEKTSRAKTNWGTRSRGEDVAESMRNYQLALYIFSYASLLEVLLLGNFDEGYLSSVRGNVETHATNYLSLYTKAFNEIELTGRSTVESHLMEGISLAAGKLGKAIEGTPVGDRTPVDETLISAGEKLKSRKDSSAMDPALQLCIAKGNVSQPFIEGIDGINSAYNEPLRVLTDDEDLYLLPIDES